MKCLQKKTNTSCLGPVVANLSEKRLLDESLDACTVVTIRRFFRRVFQYMSVYRQGVTGLLTELAVKRYSSHRGVTVQDISEAKEA